MISNRPFFNSELLAFLRDSCKMRVINLQPEGGFKFDSVLAGPDLLNIVLIESKRDSSIKALKEVSRKVQSFAWSIYAQQKHNLVTLILVLPQVPAARELRRALAGLNGSARVFILSEDMNTDQMQTALKPLAAPAFTISGKAAIGFEQLQGLLQGIPAAEIVEMARSSVSDEELKSKLTDRFERLALDVNHALKKA